MMNEDIIPIVTVGIVSAQRIDFCFNCNYQTEGNTVSGPQTVEISNGILLWNGRQYHKLCFIPEHHFGAVPPHPSQGTDQGWGQSFTLNDVTIGNGFHWERHQKQTFLGTLWLIANADEIVAINELPVEDYLESVIASEMSATSSLEFLKAHAVISRSWLLYQKASPPPQVGGASSTFSKENELIRWYDREDHALFDVCADDHCQRYQGITHEVPSEAAGVASFAVRATRGQVLTYHGELCDTRFSKCCGGRTEEFQYCWENTPKSYLQSVECHWCDTKDQDILRQVLNDYDQETADFHDWTVEYTADELSQLVREKLKTDLGDITDLIPLNRGKSGRIWRLQIVGTKRSLIIGKELEIRRALSPTHLYSSNFEVEKKEERGKRREEREYLKFLLHGHGWGHGVGLCQIGAAVMAHEGRSYQDILLHYYPGAEIKEIY